jgi:hypothetical protein
MKSGNRVSLIGIFECLAAALLLSAAAPPARAQLQFSGPTNYPVGKAPDGVAVGDFNGDGKTDLAVVNTGGQTVGILLGNGDGTFQSAVNYPCGSTCQYVAVGDFRGDGKLDLAVSNGSANNVSILLGNGDGTFQAPVQYDIGASADYVEVADFNNDKKLDLLVSTSGAGETSNPVAGSIAILLGNGDGTFQAAKTTSTGSFAGTTPFVAIGDFNGDGKPDVATGNDFINPNCIPHEVGSNCTEGNVIVFLGNGDGTFQSPLTSVVNFGVAFLIAGDFNGDGKIDLALAGVVDIANLIGGTTPNRLIAPALGNGDGTFSVADTLLTVGASEFIANVGVADLNADGRLDLIVPVVVKGAGISAAVYAFLGNGDGTFQPSQQFALVTGANTLPLGDFTLALGDFNAAGLADVVVTDSPENNVSVLLNATPTFKLTAQSSSLTVASGNSQMDVLSVAGVNGFANPVDLACAVSGPEPLAACSLSSSSVTPGVSPGTSTMTITAPMTAAMQPRSAPNGLEPGALAYAVALLLTFGIVVFAGSKRRQRAYWLMCGVLALLCGLQAACGGGGSGAPPPPPAQTFTVTVTATSGAIQETTQVTVTVP